MAEAWREREKELCHAAATPCWGCSTISSSSLLLLPPPLLMLPWRIEKQGVLDSVRPLLSSIAASFFIVAAAMVVRVRRSLGGWGLLKLLQNDATVWEREREG